MATSNGHTHVTVALIKFVALTFSILHSDVRRNQTDSHTRAYNQTQMLVHVWESLVVFSLHSVEIVCGFVFLLLCCLFCCLLLLSCSRSLFRATRINECFVLIVASIIYWESLTLGMYARVRPTWLCVTVLWIQKQFFASFVRMYCKWNVHIIVCESLYTAPTVMIQRHTHTMIIRWCV